MPEQQTAVGSRKRVFAVGLFSYYCKERHTDPMKIILIICPRRVEVANQNVSGRGIIRN